MFNPQWKWTIVYGLASFELMSDPKFAATGLLLASILVPRPKIKKTKLIVRIAGFLFHKRRVSVVRNVLRTHSQN